MGIHEGHGGAEGVRQLSHEDAWARLRSMVVGRLAFSLDGRLEIIPVNYLVDRGTLLFRTAPGTKFAASIGRLPAVFEVDGYEQEQREAWSVVAHGHLEPVLDTAEVIDVVALRLFPWQGGEKGLFVRVVPEEVTGRQFPFADPAHWVSPLTGIRRAPTE